MTVKKNACNLAWKIANSQVVLSKSFQHLSDFAIQIQPWNFQALEICIHSEKLYCLGKGFMYLKTLSPSPAPPPSPSSPPLPLPLLLSPFPLHLSVGVPAHRPISVDFLNPSPPYCWDGFSTQPEAHWFSWTGWP